MYMAFSAIGPAMGFVVGGIFLQLYADFLVADMDK